MGLFEKKKKDAERCPICGKEISFFSGLVIADGNICDDCEKMVRGQFNIEEYYGRENWKISTSDPLKAMTVEELKDMIKICIKKKKLKPRSEKHSRGNIFVM